ncbi:MAG: hypothetical protein JWP52_2837 [Rhizobacter sp.]|nr:hypothetical protein [Rhizobacter sp.]
MPVTTVILEVIKHTPTWVWLVLLALIAFGSMQLRNHQVSRQRVLIQPMVIGGYSLWGAASVFGPHAAVFGAWLLGVALAFALNRLIGLPRQVSYDAGNDRFNIGGSASPMALMLTVFAVRYAVVVTLVFHHELAGQALFVTGMCALYGLLSGLVAARGWKILSTARGTGIAGAAWAAAPEPGRR